jgi:hypothetical protein
VIEFVNLISILQLSNENALNIFKMIFIQRFDIEELQDDEKQDYEHLGLYSVVLLIHEQDILYEERSLLL